MTAAFPNGLYILDHQIELGQRSTTLHSNIFTSKLIKKSNAEQCMIMKTFAIYVIIWRSQIIQLHVHQPHAIVSCHRHHPGRLLHVSQLVFSLQRYVYVLLCIILLIIIILFRNIPSYTLLSDISIGTSLVMSNNINVFCGMCLA